MAGRNSRTRRKCERRFTERVRWLEASVEVRIGVPWATPALLIRIVGAPWVARMVVAVEVTAEAEVMSQG